jgi:prepilin-type N-terminal cleavage/methylation domain-containing protein/prepilin-type processing-associated H-X9-DG protein
MKPLNKRLRPAFTLIELLVAIGIIGALTGMLLPALGKAKTASLRLKCLSNMRNLEIAHWMYTTDNKGKFIQVGLAHGGVHSNEELAWINTLQQYYGSKLLHRSPIDHSPHWPIEEGGQGVPVPDSGGTQFRRTSYGVNNFLDPNTCPWGGPYHLDNVRAPAATVHFLIMAFEGPFAGADHPHVENWNSNPPVNAAENLQTNAHGGDVATWDAVSNYGFLDGHAEARPFRKVFTDFNANSFDPAVAR